MAVYLVLHPVDHFDQVLLWQHRQGPLIGRIFLVVGTVADTATTNADDFVCSQRVSKCRCERWTTPYCKGMHCSNGRGISFSCNCIVNVTCSRESYELYLATIQIVIRIKELHPLLHRRVHLCICRKVTRRDRREDVVQNCAVLWWEVQDNLDGGSSHPR